MGTHHKPDANVGASGVHHLRALSLRAEGGGYQIVGNAPELKLALLQPNLTDITAHLYALFEPAFVHPHPDAWIEIAVSHAHSGKVNEAQNFSVFDLRDAAKYAEAITRAGHNVYVGVATRQGKQPRSGRATDDHYLASAFAWCEYDNAGDDERISRLLQQNKLVPALIVTTGTAPHVRKHLYFKIIGIKDGAHLITINASLQRLLGSDNVKNASRVLRLAGTINYPNKDKIARGYVPELTKLQINKTAPTYQAATFIGLSASEGPHHNNVSMRTTQPTDSNVYELYEYRYNREHGDSKRLSDDEVQALLAKHPNGKNEYWHNDLRAASMEMLNRGCDPYTIRLALAPYCEKGAHDPDLDDLIDKKYDELQAEKIAAEQAEEQSTDNVSPKPKASSRLSYFGEFGSSADRRPILQGFLYRGEISSTIAAPKRGKSAFWTEVSVHCGAKKDWRGHRIKERCGVVIFALERGDLYQRRLDAYRLRDGYEKLPIAVRRGVIDLLNPKCVQQIVAEVREVEQHTGCTVGLIIFDTFSKAISVSGDEDKAKDQNRAAVNLRRLLEVIDVHIATVGHTGKDESRGERGSNARLGDIDVLIAITGAQITKTATVVEANDQPERAIAQFRLELIELGHDEDGDPKMVSIIAKENVETDDASKDSVRLNATQRRAMELLVRTVNEYGRSPPASGEYPRNIRVVSVKEWQTMCERIGLSSSEDKGNRDRAFRRARDELFDLKQIGTLDGLVWIAYYNG